MKCPNCRCIVASNLYVCNYCGYEFSTGSAKTLTVEQAREDRLYYDAFRSYSTYQNFPYNSAFNDDCNYGFNNCCGNMNEAIYDYVSTDSGDVKNKLLLLMATCIALIICSLILLLI